MSSIPKAALTLATATAVSLALASAARADTVVQVPLPGLLDARSVTTLTDGKLVVFTLPTDGGGLQNAFATAAVAQMQGAPPANALPDDGRFAANARHPEVLLNFSNAAAADAPQTHLVAPSASFDFAVPAATYSKLFLFFNGAAGGSTVKVTLGYADATMDQQSATVPDYYMDISPTDPVIFNLATGLAKWDKTHQINEADHHNITGVELNGLPGKTLQTVKVERGAEGTLVFWGATGIATSQVAGGGAAGAAGQSGAGGAAGAGSAAGGAAGATALTGGAGSGGSSAGSSGAGGAATVAGAAGAGVSSAGASTGAGAGASAGPGDDGCGCRLGAARSSSLASLLALVGLSSVARRRKLRSARR